MLKETYTIKDYWPLMLIFLVGLLAGLGGWLVFADIMRAMTLFMGSALFLLSGLKVSNLSEFAMAFSTYDLLAGRSDAYARGYPFIELLLAFGYLFGVYLVLVNTVTLLVMSIGAVGVYQNMKKDEVLMCACLGAVFNVPMTWVTLIEDVVMALMAGSMLLVLL